MRRNGGQLLLRVAKRRQLPAKHASRIDIDRSVQPLWFANRSVPVHDHCLATIIGCPVVAHREPEFVRLPCGFAEQRERPDGCGAPPLHFFLHARMRHDQLAIV